MTEKQKELIKMFAEPEQKGDDKKDWASYFKKIFNKETPSSSSE